MNYTKTKRLITNKTRLIATPLNYTKKKRLIATEKRLVAKKKRLNAFEWSDSNTENHSGENTQGTYIQIPEICI